MHRLQRMKKRRKRIEERAVLVLGKVLLAACVIGRVTSICVSVWVPSSEHSVLVYYVSSSSFIFVYFSSKYDSLLECAGRYFSLFLFFSPTHAHTEYSIQSLLLIRRTAASVNTFLIELKMPQEYQCFVNWSIVDGVAGTTPTFHAFRFPFSFKCPRKRNSIESMATTVYSY